MDEKLREMLCKEIEDQINVLGLLNPGTEDYSRQVENIATLYRLKMEEDQAINEIENKDKIDITKFIELGISAAGIVLPLAFYGVWMKRGLKFEQTGTFTSTTFRGLFQKFKTTR